MKKYPKTRVSKKKIHVKYEVDDILELIGLLKPSEGKKKIDAEEKNINKEKLCNNQVINKNDSESKEINNLKPELYLENKKLNNINNNIFNKPNELNKESTDNKCSNIKNIKDLEIINNRNRKLNIKNLENIDQKKMYLLSSNNDPIMTNIQSNNKYIIFY